MRIRARKVSEGPHPGKIIIAVTTADRRQETLLVDQRILTDGAIEVGRPIGHAKGRILVELPRQTISGVWRVWISDDVAVKDAPLLSLARAAT